MKKNQKRLGIFTALMAALPLHAATLSELEPNQSIQSSQYITVNDKMMAINAAIGTVGSATPTNDVDIYSFYAQRGDVVTLDIDYGYGGQQKIDTIMAVFNPSGKVLRMVDEATSLDPGSTSRHDSRIDNFVVPATGIYYVGVSTYPRFFQSGGIIPVRNVSNGDYLLEISGVSPSVIQISIDVKPGTTEPAPINLKSKGKIPVALLTDGKFNAMEADVATVTFGVTGNEASLSKCNTSGEDVNGDGLLDLVCHFDNQATAFGSATTEGILRGKTRGGAAFEGRGFLKIIPALTK